MKTNSSLTRSHSPFFKIIALAVTFTFLYQQIVLAADYTYALPADNERNNVGFMSTERLAEAQKRQEELIGKLDEYLRWQITNGSRYGDTINLQRKVGPSQQAPQQPPNPVQSQPTNPSSSLSITTAEGDTLIYNGDRIERVEKKDGTVIDKIELSESGDIVNAFIRYPDGVIVDIVNGKIRSGLAIDGTATHYREDGLIDSQIDKDGVVSLYGYETDQSGNIIRTIVTKPDSIATYDVNSRLEKVMKTDGTEIDYEDGIISEMKKPDGSRYIFATVEEDGLLELRLATYIGKDGLVVDFDEEMAIRSSTAPDGVHVVYSPEGRPVSAYKGDLFIAYDDAGNISEITEGSKKYTFVYQFDATGKINLTTVTDVENGTARYGANGSLSSLEKDGSIVDSSMLKECEDEYIRLKDELDGVVSLRKRYENDLILKKTALDEAVKIKDEALAAYNSSAARLADATAARKAAEDALPGEASGYYSQYSYNAGSLSLSQYQLLLNEKFNSYNSSIWNKASDTYCRFTSGEALLKGTGINTNANFGTKQVFARSKLPAFAFDFQVDNSNGKFTGSVDNNAAGSANRRLAVVVADGSIKIQTYNGSAYTYVATAVAQIKLNSCYSALFETTLNETKVYVWETGQAKPAAPCYVWSGTTWDAAMKFSTYSGKARVDNARVKSGIVAAVKDYNENGYMVKQDLRDGLVTGYNYGSGFATSTITDNFDKQTTIWKMPAASYYSLSGGALTLKGNSKDLSANVSMSSAKSRASEPVYALDFSTNNANANLVVGLEGKIGSTYKRIALIANGGKVMIESMTGSTGTNVATAIPNLKINTFYSARFEVASGAIKIYVWERGGQEPASPTYIFNCSGWDTTFHMWNKTGNAVIDSFSAAEKIATPAQDIVIAGLINKIKAEKTLEAQFLATKGNYEGALSAEGAARISYEAASAALNEARLREAEIASLFNAAKDRVDMQNAFLGGFKRKLADYDSGIKAIKSSDIMPKVGSDIEFKKALYYGNKNLKRVDFFDGSIQEYDENGFPISAENAAGAKAGYFYLFGNLDNVTSMAVEREGLRRIYDLNGDLKSVITSNDTKMEFSGDEIRAITTPDGLKRLYAGGTLEEAVNKEGTKFTLGANGKVIKAVDKDGNVYDYSYSIDPVDNKEVTLIYDPANEVKRFYKDGLLYRTEDPTGLVAENVYYPDKKIKEATVSKNGNPISKYSYVYPTSWNGTSYDIYTIVRDAEGNIRKYDEKGKIYNFETKDGLSYWYDYANKYLSVMNLKTWTTPNGDRAYYQDGDLTSFYPSVNKFTFENIKSYPNGLLEYELRATGSRIKKIAIYGDYKKVATERGTYLYFRNSDLIAVATTQELVMLKDNENIPPELINGMKYEESYKLPTVDNLSWYPQGYWNTRAITGLTKDAANNQLALDMDLIPGDSTKSLGEAFIDLRYSRNLGTDYLKDLTGREVSFYIKVPKGFLEGHKEPFVTQAFAKDFSWSSLYGPTVNILEEDTWYKVKLRVNSGLIPGGEGNSGFRSDKVALLGIRVKALPAASEAFNGQIIVKDGDCVLPEGTRVIEVPALANLSEIKETADGINGVAHLVASKDYVSTEDMNSVFEGAPQAAIQNINMSGAAWKPMNYQYTRGLTSVTRDEANDQWVISADIDNSGYTKNKGEIFLDIKNSIPGLDWNGPIDMIGKTLSFLVKAPEGFVVDPKKPNWAQVYLKDVNWSYIYGPSVKIDKANQWLRVSLAVNGTGCYSSQYFDPTNIQYIGIKISGEYAAPIKYNGPIYLKSEVTPDVFEKTGYGVLLDLKGVGSYLASCQKVLNMEAQTAASINYGTQKIAEYNLPTDTIIRQEFVNDTLKSVEKADKITTYYTYNGKIDYVADYDGRMIVDYEYDDNWDLEWVRMQRARYDLARSIQDADNKVNENKVAALAELARQRGIVVGQIGAEVAPDLNGLISQRDSLRNQWNNLNSQDVGWDPFGNKRKEKSRALDEIARAIDQVNSAISQVYGQVSGAYGQVDTEIAKLAGQIDEQASTAFSQVKTEEDRLLVDIIRQEATPFILHYYRVVLGRDPDAAETAGWLAKLSIDRQKITKVEMIESIMASSEYNSRKASVDRIKSDVRLKLEAFLKSDSQGKDAFLATLGLTQANIAKFNEHDIDRILKWLDSQGLHFGHSAFLALKNVLAANNVEAGLEGVAAGTILIDILTGSIDIFTIGDLEISMNALSKYAATKGVTLYNAKIDFGELAAKLPQSGNVIVHIDGNHYIVVTRIDGDKVYYREENRGSSGTDEVMSRDEFLKKWQGYVITKTAPQDPAKILSTEEAKKIKGAFFIFLIPLIGAIISAISGVIAGIVTAVAGIITAVMGAVAMAISNIAAFIVGIGSQIMGGIGAALGGLSSFFGGFVGGSFIGAAIKTLVGAGLSLGISTGLQALGVNSTISNLTSAFLTGGILGILSPIQQGVSFFGAFVSEGLRCATIAGIGEIGTKLKLDPNITGLIGITAGALVGGMWQGKIGSTLVNIAPKIASELAFYGINKAGEALGIDPRISQLAGIGIRSSISAGLSSQWKPEVMWESVQNGLLRGITSVSLEWGAQALGLSPLIGSLTSAAIAGGIEALLMGQNPIQGIFDTYFRAGTGMLTLGGDGGNNPWLRAAYISQVLDFSQIVQERGIVNALETYAAGFLHQQTINEIWKQGGIAELLTKPNQIEITTNAKGETVKRIYTLTINSDADKLISNYIDLSPTYDMLVGYRQGNVITHCDFVIGPDGRPQLKNGEREILNADGSKRVETVENFNLTKMDYLDASGNKIGYYVPATGTGSIIVGADGKVTSGKFVSLVTNYNVSTKDNQVTDFGLKRDYVFSEAQRTNLLNSGITEQDLYGFKEVVSFANGMLQYFVLPPDTPIFNIDQGAGKAWLNSIEADGRAFWTGLYDLIGQYTEGDPLPTFMQDAAHTIASIDLNLKFPIESENAYQGALDLFSLFIGNPVGIVDELGSIPFAWSRWNYSTDNSAQLYASRFNEGYDFVIGSGANLNGWSIEDASTIYSKLNTEKKVGFGFSADVTSTTKSWLVPNSVKADYYVLSSPQFIFPETVSDRMKSGGISGDRVIVIETAGDFVSTIPGSFADNRNSDDSLKWHYIKLQAGDNLSSWNILNNHGAAVNGIINGVVYDEIIVDGVTRYRVTLEEALRDIIN